EAATLALRTQQILAYESGLDRTVDPLAGSYYVESLTDRIEAEARALIGEVDELGGAAAAIEKGFFQRRIGESAWELQKAVEAGEVVVVGVNRFAVEEPPPRMDAPDFPGLATRQRARVAEARARRNAGAVEAALAALTAAARGDGALMPPIVDAVRARATIGEISDALRAVWGEYRG
ncbi:MAG TPA: methylmalonyl-CoA mutase family protein, partial [Gemmatimonadales bacterium]